MLYTFLPGDDAAGFVTDSVGAGAVGAAGAGVRVAVTGGSSEAVADVALVFGGGGGGVEGVANRVPDNLAGLNALSQSAYEAPAPNPVDNQMGHVRPVYEYQNERFVP